MYIMRKNFAMMFFSFMFISTLTYAQNQTLKVLVTDSETGNPIENATIILSNNLKIAATNAFGNFNFSKIATGKYSITCSHIGYMNTSADVFVKDNSTTTVNVKLKTSSLTFSSITLASNKTNLYSKISSIDLLLRPVNSAQNVLRMVPSLFIAQHAGGGKAEQIFLRGFDIDHGTDISITVDGMPVNMISHAHGQGYADLHFLIPETIEKVNFDKGPYNAEKGNLATAGFVDFKTKDFISSNTVKIETGKFNMQRISGQIKLLSTEKENSKQQLYAASEYYKSDGYFESPQKFDRFNAMAKYSLQQNSNTKLNILFSTFKSKWNASGQIPERSVNDGSITKFGSIDDTEGGNTSRTNFSVQFSKRLSNNWNIEQQAYFSNYKFNLFSNFTFFLNDTIDGDMINQNEERNIYGYLIKANKQTNIGNKKIATTIGAGIRFDDVKKISLAATPKRIFKSYFQQGSIQEMNVFAFTNSTLDLTKKLSISGSLRYDYFRFGYKNKLLNETGFKYQEKGTFSPKLNLNYSLSNKVNIFLSNGIGFHSNDTRVILDEKASKILPKVYGTDIGVSFKPTKNLILKTILWHLFSEQEFVYVGDEGVVEPSGRSRRLGVDVIARYQINKWLYSDLDISFARARAIDEKKGEDYIPLAPLFTSIGGLTAKVNNKLSASLRYRFLNTRPASEDYSVVAKGYFLVDATANYKWKKFDFSVSAENLLNASWKEAQFNTESKLLTETNAVSEIHYTPGTPFFIKGGVSISF
jgi:CarboxypepD_reg-like domain/TonB-dependent Receptor Plug Domain